MRLVGRGGMGDGGMRGRRGMKRKKKKKLVFCKFFIVGDFGGFGISAFRIFLNL